MKIQDVKNITSKGSRDPFLTNRIFFRHISVYVTYIFLKLRIPANTVTFLSSIVAITGAFLQVYNDMQILLISCVLLNSYYILDMADGEIARYNIKKGKRQPNEAGPYFDALVHYFLTPLLFFSVGLFCYHKYGAEIYLWAGLIVGMWLSSYAQSAANRVILDFLLQGNRDPNGKIIDELWRDNKYDNSKASIKQRVRFLIREAFSSQGQIITLTLLIILDWIFQPGISFRAYYLLIMAGIALLNMPRVSYKYFRMLKEL
ncbi:MAG: CDP-alcohol phosphatidyltransferase family protein [Candidatus Marinimicrobia bacterium]|nr:CDP-alcohol phosphatidyltransferase family protein [Candidatus Neomarinimicrobiota bacterium]MCF7828785.1 CDP-alcohol phosphatidyltransferase family protein [Candidatus Neomarinimicrobiota bacterium]MCF7880702.1 CDP-alcohol phosphatidyltransferase family protein [Candidatus Neomarinimicrobiota bacterium]